MPKAKPSDVGYSVGRWWLIQPSTGMHLGGRYIAIWQPNRGQWELTHVSANNDDDVAAQEPPM